MHGRMCAWRTEEMLTGPEQKLQLRPWQQQAGEAGRIRGFINWRVQLRNTFKPHLLSPLSCTSAAILEPLEYPRSCTPLLPVSTELLESTDSVICILFWLFSPTSVYCSGFTTEGKLLLLNYWLSPALGTESPSALSPLGAHACSYHKQISVPKHFRSTLHPVTLLRPESPLDITGTV